MFDILNNRSRRQFLQLCFKYASEQIIVKIGCSKYQTLFKLLIRNIFQGMYCRAHKTATLTPIQYIVPPPSPQAPTSLKHQQHPITDCSYATYSCSFQGYFYDCAHHILCIFTKNKIQTFLTNTSILTKKGFLEYHFFRENMW